MPLQLTPEVYKWLQSHSLISNAKRNSNNFMQIDQQSSQKLMDGFVLVPLIKSLLKAKNQDQKLKKLQLIKDNNTPAIRLYNWGIYADLLKHFGFNLDAAQKSKIINYQPQPLSRLFNYLNELRLKDHVSIKQDKMLKVDIAQIGKKTLKQTNNSLQLLTVCISRHFKISPQQTLNLYLDNNKYLSHLLVKGVKNSYEPIHNLLQQLKSNAQFVVMKIFCLDQEQNVTFLFNALRSSLISKDETTASIYCGLLGDIYDQYKLNVLNLQIVRSWFLSQGINTLFFSIKKHPALTKNIFDICYCYLDDDFFKQILPTEKSILWSGQRERLSFYRNLCECMEKQFFNKFCISNAFDQWNKLILKIMKKIKQNYEIFQILSIMEQQWQKLLDKFQTNQLNLANQYINFLKNQMNSQNELVFVQVMRTMFSLMHSLGLSKNQLAPLIYKNIISKYSSLRDGSKIILMTQNFKHSFKGISNLPGSSLVQPIIKHFDICLDMSLFQLIQILVEQKRIDQEQSMGLIQIMTKIAFTDIKYGQIALNMIFVLLQKTNQTDRYQYLINNISLSISMFYSHSKTINKSINLLKQQVNKIETQNKNADQLMQKIDKHILCRHIISFIGKSITQYDYVKNQNQVSLFYTYLKIKVQLKKQEQAQLLKPLLVSYYPQQDDLKQKIQFYMNEAYPPKPQSPPKGHNHLSRSLVLRPKTTQTVKSLMDPSLLKPTQFALKDLQKVKQRKFELKTIQIQQQKDKAIKEQKLQKFKTIQQQKRLIQSMASIKNDVEYKPIRTLQIQQTINKDQANSANIKLLNLQKQQQDSYREDVQALMKKYRKVWRYLFYKYSVKKTQNGGQEKAHMGDVWKMLKDYQFSFLKKQQVFTIIRLINQNLKRKNDIQYLVYQGFEQCIIQLSIIGFTRVGYSHLSPGKQLNMFINQLKKVTKQKSGGIQIFQNPQQAYFQQTDVIREFNRRLKDNPEYILPEGYKKIKNVTLQFQNDFHPMLQKNIKSSYIEVLQVLDSIFFKCFQIHIIEPLSIKAQQYLARPALFQNINQKMKQYTKGYLQPKKPTSLQVQKQTLQLPSPVKRQKQFKPFVNFSLGVKLGLAETSLKNKSIAQQVAYCMEDMLNAIENNQTVINKKAGKKKIGNQFLRKKRLELIKVQSQRKKQQSNWKKRAESVKLEVQILRQKRKQAEKVNKKKQYLSKKAQRQKQQKIYKQKMAQFQRVKSIIAEKKQKLLQIKQAEQQKVKKQKQQYRQGVQQYFRRKKQQLKQKEEQYKKKKNEQKIKKQQNQNNKKQFAKKLYMNNLRKQQQILQKVDEIKQNYQDTFKSQQIQDVIKNNRKSLKLLFDLLLKYQKSKISATNYDQIGLGTLNFFCMKFKIVPFLLEKQDVTKMFVFATKSDEQKKINRKGINQQKFQQVIFLIAVKAKKLLNKIIEKRQKKQKKLQAFLNAQKSSQGNHFQVQDASQSDSSSEQSDQQKPTLQDEYLFNAQDVDEDTIKQIFNLLRLPSDKQAMQDRYKQALQTKNTKPKNALIKELRQKMEQPSI